MFISGNISDFSNRLHQLPSGWIDLRTGFLLGEAINYTGLVDRNTVEKWNKEYNYQFFRFTGTGSYLTGRDFFVN